ncbi:MAG TPA: hypothetical protein VLQ90_05680 [Pyrinomonadaceae bacterium]|nr:hypothetical protein [Pyrinomonadaceae bacterium]
MAITIGALRTRVGQDRLRSDASRPAWLLATACFRRHGKDVNNLEDKNGRRKSLLSTDIVAGNHKTSHRQVKKMKKVKQGQEGGYGPSPDYS